MDDTSEKIIFQTDDGTEEEFFVEAQIRVSGRDYLLVSDGDEEEAECWIFADMSEPGEDVARYVPVEDEETIGVLMPLFEEEMEDTDITR